MAINDDDDLEEYDADVFHQERLIPARLRKDWDHRRNRTAALHHDRAQLLTLANSYSASALPRFRDQLRYNCGMTLEEIDRRLLKVFVGGHAMDLLALAHDRLHQMYLAECGSESAAKKLAAEKAEDDKAEVIAALIAGQNEVDGRRVVLHEAQGLTPGKSGSDKDIRDMLRVSLASPKTILGPCNRAVIDEVAAALYATSPWMREVVNFIWSSMLDSLEERGTASIPPLLLVGPPGCGKTYVAEHLAGLLGRPWKRLDGAAMTSAFAVAGGDFLWRHSHPSEVVRMIAASGAANPLVVFDEVEKATGSSGGDARLALLPLLQRDTASRYQDPYLQAQIDLAHVDWILLANSTESMPPPLLDRVNVFKVSYPEGEDLVRTVERALAAEAADPAVIRAVVAKIESRSMTLRGIDRIKSQLRAINRRPLLN